MLAGLVEIIILSNLWKLVNCMHLRRLLDDRRGQGSDFGRRLLAQSVDRSGELSLSVFAREAMQAVVAYVLDTALTKHCSLIYTQCS